MQKLLLLVQAANRWILKISLWFAMSYGTEVVELLIQHSATELNQAQNLLISEKNWGVMTTKKWIVYFPR